MKVRVVVRSLYPILGDSITCFAGVLGIEESVQALRSGSKEVVLS